MKHANNSSNTSKGVYTNNTSNMMHMGLRRESMRAQETEARRVKQIQNTENAPILMHPLCKSARANTHATDMHTHANIHTKKHTQTHTHANTRTYTLIQTQKEAANTAAAAATAAEAAAQAFFFRSQKTICCQNKREKELLKERMHSERDHVDHRERECVEVCLKKRERKSAHARDRRKQENECPQ